MPTLPSRADLGGVPVGDALAAATTLPAAQGMPSAVSVFCGLAPLFKNFLQPMTILSAIPYSLGVAFVALLLGRSELDVPATIGLVMPMGIVIENSILRVERTIVGRRDRGRCLFDALDGVSQEVVHPR